MVRLAILAALLIVPATPAFALNCYGAGGAARGLTLGLEFRFGELTEQDEANLDLMRLRRAGVDATSVEYWNGCIRAWVPNSEGVGQHMEYYDPRTLRRVDE